MFPLNWNIPFIRKNGSRTTLGDITGDIAGIEEDVAGLTADKVSWDDYSEVGAVNYAPNKLASGSGTNYSYSVDSDGVITVEVTNTLSASAIININSALSLKNGTYKLSGCADNGSVSTYRLQIYTSDNTPIAIDYGKNGTPYPGDKGDTFTLSSDTTGLVLALRLGNGLTTGTYKFYPMVTPPSYNGPYVPYAMTNGELTDSVSTLSSDLTNLLTTSLSDCNTVPSNGRLCIFRSSSSTLNSPYTAGVDTGNQSHVILSLIDTNGNWGVQLAIPVTSTKGLFMRFKASGTWGAWSKITP